jgi:C1A family cysteine protease
MNKKKKSSQNKDFKNYLKKQPVYVIENVDSVIESFNQTPQIIIPPLNTDIRFKDKVPKLKVKKEFFSPTDKNFSWGIINSNDSDSVIEKKKLIRPVREQYACGSCWAIAIADSFSDCLVVSGAVNWSPKISATQIMSCIPYGESHMQCFGGNPAAVAKILESKKISDQTCVDYSWCSQDTELCTSVDSVSHFDAEELSTRLNANIPKPCGCFYEGIKKFVYKLDSGTKFLAIDSEVTTPIFRSTIKNHLLEYGPIIGGYVVCYNFFTGNFADPDFNGGIYFDRADYNNYSSGEIFFSDTIPTKVAGLHAVSIIGWGEEENVQYDNGKYGTVPYWHCRNSWGTQWGDNGYFKMAMYPYNQTAQFDKQVMTDLGGPVGSMLLIKATQPPEIYESVDVDDRYINIKKKNPNQYYQLTVDEISESESKSDSSKLKIILPIIIIIVIIAIVIIFKSK